MTRWFLRLYRVILLFYPRSFREEFGDEIMRDCAERLGHASRRSRTGLLVMEQLADLVTNVPVQWFRTGIPGLVAISASCSGLLFGLIALQGLAPSSPAFAPLHGIWLFLITAVVLTSLALGHYLSRQVP